MNSNPPPPENAQGELIASLVRTLYETERRLQELTHGQMDAVMLPAGQSFLLSQAQTRLRESEEKFRQMAENISDVLWIRSPDMKQLYYLSPAFERIWGRPVSDLINHPLQWVEYIFPADRDRVQAAFAGLCGDGLHVDIEYRILRPGGEIRWIRARGFKVLDPAGKVIRLTGIVTDITERKQVEFALRESEERFSGAFLHAPIGVALVAPDGHWLKVNQAFCRIVGYSEAELLAGRFQDITCPEDLAPDLEYVRQVVAGEISTYQIEKRYVHKSGKLVTVLLNVSLVRNAENQPAYFISQIQDITQRKLAEQELSHTNRALRMSSEGNERLIRAKSEQELLDQICQVAVDIGGYRMAWVGYAQDDDFRSIQPMAHAGEENGYFSEIQLSWSEHPVNGRGPAGCTIRNGTAQICEDMSQEASLIQSREQARQRGYRGVICLPLRENNRTFGLLGLYSADVIKVDAGEMKQLQKLADNLAFGIGHLRAESRRQTADTKVREQAALLNATTDAIVLKDMDDQILFWNRGAEQIYGWTEAEAIGKKSRELLSSQFEAHEDAIRILQQKNHWQGEIKKTTKDGRVVTVETRWTLMRDAAGQPKSVLDINTDITERKKLEAQFLRMQRMESIGTLAAGVAHDLNNILAPITMSIQLLQEDIPETDRRSLLATLLSSSQRGAELVKQVLTFARGVEGQRTTINLAHLIQEIQKIVRETFPPDIIFRFNSGRNIWMVTGDPTQLHQVLINLCVNARDAMPRGGKLTIDLANHTLDEVAAGQNPGSKPGPYVIIQVADTGTGIPAEIQEKIFEPFFTTKDVGKGTGLGLSTTLTIIKSHGGSIHVHSAPGQGSVFKIYLPAHPAAPVIEDVAAGQNRLSHGQGELILVVDDEESIRLAARRILERYGYRVLLATNGAEAVSLYAQHGQAIAVVLTDMAMPVMDGPATIIALELMNPSVKIIGSSGHASKEGVAKAVGAGVKHFLPKPYTAERLLKVVEQVLREPASP